MWTPSIPVRIVAGEFGADPGCESGVGGLLECLCHILFPQVTMPWSGW